MENRKPALFFGVTFGGLLNYFFFGATLSASIVGSVFGFFICALGFGIYDKYSENKKEVLFEETIEVKNETSNNP